MFTVAESNLIILLKFFSKGRVGTSFEGVMLV